jgi:hypothetical protein
VVLTTVGLRLCNAERGGEADLILAGTNKQSDWHGRTPDSCFFQKLGTTTAMYFASFLDFGKRSAHAFTSKTLSDDVEIWFKSINAFPSISSLCWSSPGNTVMKSFSTGFSYVAM